MTVTFDLISDLHLETWPGFDWTGQPTAPFCVVAGDVARDRRLLRQTLEQLGQCYHGVFFIDGNDEHRYHLENISESYQDLISELNDIPNVTFLQDNVIVMDGVAILGTNGWWSFDFDPTQDFDASQEWYKTSYEASIPHVKVNPAAVLDASRVDAAYLLNSVQRLQTHRDVKKIVIVTHTVPNPVLIEHDISLDNQLKFNSMGNQHLSLCLQADTEHKIHTWCFGHYHAPVDRMLNGVRYVNNCRGRGDTQHQQSVYYPKRITVDV